MKGAELCPPCIVARLGDSSHQLDSESTSEFAHMRALEQARSVGIVILATLAVIVALYFGREFLISIALALMLNALLRPLVRAPECLRVPTAAGAASVG